MFKQNSFFFFRNDNFRYMGFIVYFQISALKTITVLFFLIFFCYLLFRKRYFYHSKIRTPKCCVQSAKITCSTIISIHSIFTRTLQVCLAKIFYHEECLNIFLVGVFKARLLLVWIQVYLFVLHLKILQIDIVNENLKYFDVPIPVMFCF